jgi:hypothetical protein
MPVWPPHPLAPLLNEINRAASSGMPFLAISMTVALPDICVSLASPNGTTSGTQYKDWCRDNLGNNFSNLTPDDVWSVRCGVLHTGRFGHPNFGFAGIVFMPPDGRSHFINSILGTPGNEMYLYSVVEFCKNFTDAVDAWVTKNISDVNVQANLPRLMQYRNGLPPLVGAGMLVIA